jgi:predicted P-loop ATPase
MPALKAFLSSDEDTYRTPYARGPRTYKRRTVFCGTVNRWDFLADRGHNSRYAVLSVPSAIDFRRMTEIIGPQGSDTHWQVWQEVREAYLAGGERGRWWPEGQELEWIKRTNVAYLSGGSVYDTAREVLEAVWDFSCDQWTAASLRERAQGVRDGSAWVRAEQTKEVLAEVTREMSSLGREAPGRGVVLQVLRELTGQTNPYPGLWDPVAKRTVRPYLMPPRLKMFGLTAEKESEK